MPQESSITCYRTIILSVDITLKSICALVYLYNCKFTFAAVVVNYKEIKANLYTCSAIARIIIIVIIINLRFLNKTRQIMKLEESSVPGPRTHIELYHNG